MNKHLDTVALTIKKITAQHGNAHDDALDGRTRRVRRRMTNAYNIMAYGASKAREMERNRSTRGAK